MVGHFPVFFTTNDEHSFVVDKIKQAETMIQVSASIVPMCTDSENTCLRLLCCTYIESTAAATLCDG